MSVDALGIFGNLISLITLSTMTKRAEDQFKRLTEKFTSMEEMLSALTEDQLNYKFNPDTWSIIEVIQHLLLAEGGTYRYISKKILSKMNVSYFFLIF